MGTASPLGDWNWVDVRFFFYLNSFLNCFTIHINVFEAHSVSEHTYFHGA